MITSKFKKKFKKQEQVILCMDAIKVNRLTFLTTTSRNIQYQTAQYVVSILITIYKKALKEIIQQYNKAGFKIIKISSNNKFQPLKDMLYNKIRINLDLANLQEHVTEAECNSFDIEKRVRATFHQLPYKQLTKTMTTMLVMDSAKKSTSFLQSMEYYHTKALE